MARIVRESDIGIYGDGVQVETSLERIAIQRPTVDVTPLAQYDRRYYCNDCGEFSFRYAWGDDLELREGTLIPDEYRAVHRIHHTIYCDLCHDEHDWVTPVCPECHSESLDVEVIGGPFPAFRRYMTAGSAELSGEFCSQETIGPGTTIKVTWSNREWEAIVTEYTLLADGWVQHWFVGAAIMDGDY